MEWRRFVTYLWNDPRTNKVGKRTMKSATSIQFLVIVAVERKEMCSASVL